MTILHLDSGRELRGGQWQVLRLMRGLRSRGHENLLLAPANSRLLERALREKFQCDTLGVHSIRWANRQADLVHAHDARAHTMAALWASRSIVVSRRVIFPVGRNPLSRWKYGKARAYAAVSLAVAAELRRAKIPERLIRVIHDGVPLFDDKWSFKGSVLIPRFRDKLKANTLSIEAARLANVPLVRSSRLESDLEGASMLVYLTFSEGLGSAALLAMSAGIPVIASDLEGLREVVRDGENGLLVPNELEAVAAAIRSLRESPELARRLSLNARQTVIDRFSEDRMVMETIALYESILHAA